MPRTVALPVPYWLVWTSVWYHDTPKGAVGCWITNRSKPVLAGIPVTVTFIVSLSVPGVMVACPDGFGRQAEMAADDGSSGNENDEAADGAAALAAAPDEAASPTAATTAPAAATAPVFAATGEI